MKLKYPVVGLISLALIACGDKKPDEIVVPPGFCKTEVECQPEADKENARQNQLRGERSEQGVHEQYLPCGKFNPKKAANGYWSVTRDTTGCPGTASQQDPYPDRSKAKKSIH